MLRKLRALKTTYLGDIRVEAAIGLRTTCFPDTQLKLPSMCTQLELPSMCSLLSSFPLTETLNVFFSPTLENTSLSGVTCIFNDLGASTFAVYVDIAGPTLVTVRFTVKAIDVSGTIMVG